LREIGESSALYLRKHVPQGVAPALDRVRRQQSVRLAVLQKARKIETRHAARLLQGLEVGIATGLAKPLMLARPLPAAPEFMPLLTQPAKPPAVLSGRWFSGARLTRDAQDLAADGRSVSLFVLGHTVRAHRVEFTPDGVWRQSGGLFGPSDRAQRRFTGWSFMRRISAETGRLEKIRWISGPPRGHTG
jgi:hypothetical protein